MLPSSCPGRAPLWDGVDAVRGAAGAKPHLGGDPLRCRDPIPVLGDPGQGQGRCLGHLDPGPTPNAPRSESCGPRKLCFLCLPLFVPPAGVPAHGQLAILKLQSRIAQAGLHSSRAPVLEEQSFIKETQRRNLLSAEAKWEKKKVEKEMRLRKENQRREQQRQTDLASTTDNERNDEGGYSPLLDQPSMADSIRLGEPLVTISEVTSLTPPPPGAPPAGTTRLPMVALPAPDQAGPSAEPSLGGPRAPHELAGTVGARILHGRPPCQAPPPMTSSGAHILQIHHPGGSVK